MNWLRRNQLVLLFILGLLLRLYLSGVAHRGDVTNHIVWGKDSVEFGFSGIYDRDFAGRFGNINPNYPPFALFLFAFLYWFYDWLKEIAWQINTSIPLFPSKLIFLLREPSVLPALMKLPAIVADLGIAYMVFFFSQKLKTKARYIAVSLVLFNPAFFYNSAYWGQIEALPLFFVLLSFYLLFYTPYALWATTAFTLALLSKQTAVVFVPLFILILWRKYGIEQLHKSVIISYLIFWIVFFPFYKNGNIITFPLLTYWNKILTVSGLPYVTNHAFNFWALFTGLKEVRDTAPFLFGLSYRTWGYGMVTAVTAYILGNVFLRSKNITVLLYACALVPFVTFLFLTKMHERHFHHVLPFVLLLGLKDKKILSIFLFFSLFHFANLYHDWWSPPLPFLNDILISMVTITILTGIVLSIFLYLLLKFCKNVRFN